MLSKSAFPSKTPQKYLTHLLRSLKILIAKVQRDEREIIPATLIYLKTSKFSKFSKLPKFPNFPIFLNHVKTKLSTPLCFFFFSYWPLMSQSLWYSGLRPAPLPPAQPLSLSTTGLNVSCVQNSNLFLKWGGGEQMGTLGKNGAWGDATCTCPGTRVPRPCSSLCMVTRVLALQVWLSTCSMVSGREESSMCRLHS